MVTFHCDNRYCESRQETIYKDGDNIPSSWFLLTIPGYRLRGYHTSTVIFCSVNCVTRFLAHARQFSSLDGEFDFISEYEALELAKAKVKRVWDEHQGK